MKRVLNYCHEGILMSRNAHRAWSRGERPRFMFSKDEHIEDTVRHHIQRKHCNAHRMSPQKAWTLELVMFAKPAVSEIARTFEKAIQP